VIGMADGLTVPFALAAGLTGAIDASRLVVVAGLAEIVAGSIAMGLGGYLAARSEPSITKASARAEEREIIEKPAAERAEVREILEGYGLTRDNPIRSSRRSKPGRKPGWIG
jgi:VIT1/CCC1 family predicted Fe2+/Mn2+ transporter